MRPLAPLIVVGIVSELVYLLVFAREFSVFHPPGDLGSFTNHSLTGFVSFVGGFIALFLLLSLAWRLVYRTTDRTALRIVLTFGAIFGLTMVFVSPITAIDAYTYLAQSWVMVHHHQNPIFIPPSTYPNDTFVFLSGSWAGSGTPYGPLGILVDAVPTVLVGDRFLASLLLLKAMFSAMTLLSAYVVYHLLKRVHAQAAVAGALLVAWNPLILFEVSANGHNDAAMMLLVVLALLCVSRNRFLLGLALVVASALVKYATLPLVPLFLVYGLTHQPSHRQRALFVAKAALTSLVIVVVLYLPFWQGSATLTRSLLEDQFHIESFDSVVSYLFAPQISLDQATLIGRLLFLVIYLYALWLSTRRAPDLLRSCFLAMFFFVVFGANNFKIWYAVWPAVLAAATPRTAARAAALLLGCGASISAAFYSYLWDTLGFPVVNAWSYAASFVPATLTLLGLTLTHQTLTQRWPRAQLYPTSATEQGRSGIDASLAAPVAPTEIGDGATRGGGTAPVPRDVVVPPPAPPAPPAPTGRQERQRWRWTRGTIAWPDRRTRGLTAATASFVLFAIAIWDVVHQPPAPAPNVQPTANVTATTATRPVSFAPAPGPALDVLHTVGDDAGLAAPREAIVLRNQQIAVVDTGNGRLVILAPDGRIMHATRAGNLVQPFALASDGSYIYVLDAERATIERYNLKGQFVGELVHNQVLLGDGRGLAIASNALYVANPRANSIAEFALPGGTLQHVFTAAGYAQPSDVAVDAEGDVYSAEVDNDIKMRQGSGRFIQAWPTAGFITTFPVHVLPLGPGRLLASDPSGALLSYVGTSVPMRYPLRLGGKVLTQVQPQGLSRLPDGNILVADALGNRLLVIASPQ